MELGTSTRVTQKTVALRQLKTFWILANSSMVINGGVVSHEIKGYGQNVLSLGPDWVSISLSVAEI